LYRKRARRTDTDGEKQQNTGELRTATGRHSGASLGCCYGRQIGNRTQASFQMVALSMTLSDL